MQLLPDRIRVSHGKARFFQLSWSGGPVLSSHIKQSYTGLIQPILGREIGSANV